MSDDKTSDDERRAHRNRWRLLPMPSVAEIDDARAWLSSQRCKAVDGYYLERMEGPDHDAHAADEFCYQHARTMVRLLRKTSPDVIMCDATQGETDGGRYCAYRECRAELCVGSLTRYGVDSAIGITEEDPMDTGTSVYELRRSAWDMRADDERWRLWMLHVDDLRATERRR